MSIPETDPKRSKTLPLLSLHPLIWVTGFLVVNSPRLGLTVGYFSAENGSLWVASIYGTLINAIIYYGNRYFALPFFFNRRVRYLLLAGSGLVLLTAFESTLDHYWADAVMPGHGYSFWPNFFADNLLMHLLFFYLPSFFSWFFEQWQRRETQRKELEAANLRAELALLRTQIDPHFLFNALNNLYASAAKAGTTYVAEGIASLAHLTRYLMHESREESVDFIREVNYIREYVNLQTRRFDTNDEITVKLENEIDRHPNFSLPPMLFIPFVENAFKHGVRLNQPVFITINWKTKNGLLIFSCVNSLPLERKPEKPGAASGGFGLKNVRMRLDLLYPGQYELSIKRLPRAFKVHLQLPLGHE